MKKIILANEIETVEFVPMGDAVELIYRHAGARYGQRTRMTLEGARAKYLRLIAAGYYAW